MKFATALIVATVSAANKAVTQEFPQNCSTSSSTSSDPSVACSGAICCKFSDNSGNKLERCMTSTARSGAYAGTYLDD